MFNGVHSYIHLQLPDPENDAPCSVEALDKLRRELRALNKEHMHSVLSVSGMKKICIVRGEINECWKVENDEPKSYNFSTK
jgi:hypothetical protein